MVIPTPTLRSPPRRDPLDACSHMTVSALTRIDITRARPDRHARRYDENMTQLDPSFLARLRRRDPEALRVIVNEHGRRLYRAARGMGFTMEEAEDLAQDVFLTFIESIDRFEGRARVSTWLFDILHHKCQERRRVHAPAGVAD